MAALRVMRDSGLFNSFNPEEFDKEKSALRELIELIDNVRFLCTLTMSIEKGHGLKIKLTLHKYSIVDTFGTGSQGQASYQASPELFYR